MRSVVALCWMLFLLALVGTVAWLLGLGDLIRASIAAGHLLDWGMGLLCLVWLIVILKVPWDLYFQAHTVAFELQRSSERNIRTVAGRAEYIRTLQRRLGWLAVGAHLLSAALVASVATFSHDVVGYYFAVFYLASTVFRPAVAGTVYLQRKLRAIGEEARYPREDIVTLRENVRWQEVTLRDLIDQMRECRENLLQETRVRDTEDRALRQSVHAISRELEATVSRLTDNQEVIRGIQAFVRLIAQSTQT